MWIMKLFECAECGKRQEKLINKHNPIPPACCSTTTYEVPGGFGFRSDHTVSPPS